MTGNLVERLRAALDRAEEIALGTVVAAPWTVGSVTELGAADVVGAGGSHVTSAYSEPCCAEEDATFIAANGPDVVLRTIQAHRALLRMHGSCGSGSGRCDDGGHALEGEPCAEIDLLASIYFPEGTDG